MSEREAAEGQGECPNCGSDELSWVEAGGESTLECDQCGHFELGDSDE